MAAVPYISVQPTYGEVFADVSQSLLPQETAWISLYAANAPNASVHGKLLLEPCVAKSSGSAEERRDTQGGVSVKVHSGDLLAQRIESSYTDLLVRSPGRQSISSQPGPSSRPARKRIATIQAGPTVVRFSKKKIQTPIKSRIGVTAFDVSPTSNGLYAVGGEDGKLFVGSLAQGDAVASTAADNAHSSLTDDERIERLAQARMSQRLQESEREKTLRLSGHKGDIRSVKFFPSGEVILTTASDMTARIFSAKEDQNPRTFAGHKRAVLCSEIVDRGKNVITAGADGTVRLWDVAADRQVTSLASERFSSVNQIALDRSESSTSNGRSSDASVENPFSGRVLATALSSGHIELHDLASRQRAALVPTLSAFPPGPAPAASDLWEQHSVGGLFALDWDSSRHLLISGSKDGVIALHDDRMLGSAVSAEQDAPSDAMQVDPPSAPKSLLGCWRRNGASINDIRLTLSKDGQDGLDAIVATSDGLPYRANLRTFLAGDQSEQDPDYSLAPHVVEELAEWDCDNVESIGIDSQTRVWLAGTDGLLRRY